MNPQPQPDQEPLSKERLRLWLRILKLSSSVQADLRRKLRDNHDTTLPRFDVMAALSRYPDGLKMSELSDYLKVSNGNITGIIDRLAEEGLALRVAVPGDRRAMIARLTPKGTKAFADLAQHHEEWIDDRLGNLTREDAKTLTRLLNKALDDRNT